MQLTFLVDNNSLVGKPLVSESALSMYIEDGEVRLLFDTGYSDAFLVNAHRLGLDLRRLDWIALSHGHFDHTWGLDHFVRHYFESVAAKLPISRPKLLAHPQAFVSKSHRGEQEIGTLFSEEKLARHFDLRLTDEPVRITDRLFSLGAIERTLDFEPPTTLGKRLDPAGEVDDLIPDDTALAYVSGKGLIVIAGCAHTGICNTVEQAKRVTGVDKVHTVLGGFHLQKASPERLAATSDYLAALGLDGLYACHCTDLAAKIALASKCPIREVGSGLTLEF